MGAIITFIIILSVLVLVHELGHFILARKAGIKVEEFGFGYPPRLWGKKIGETTYSLNLLPIGGFVRLFGEDYLEDKDKVGPEAKRAFFNQRKRIRIAVLLAGVVMNFLLGVVLFAAVYTKIGIPEEVDYLKVTGLAEGAPAMEAGLKLEDKIVGVVGYEGEALTEEFVDFVKARRGQTVVLKLIDGKEIAVVPRLEEDTPEGEGALGVLISSVDLVQYPLWQRPFRGAVVGVKEAWGWGKDIIQGLAGMISRLVVGEVPKDVAGPVGIFQISKDITQEGIVATLQFMGILSINLAILNLLPIPALDGGRLMFVLAEAVTRKRVNPKIEQWVHLIGMVFLLGLMVVITINDIRRLAGT